MSEPQSFPALAHEPAMIGPRPRKRILLWVLLAVLPYLVVLGSCGYVLLRYTVLEPDPGPMLARFCEHLNQGDLHGAYQFFDFHDDPYETVSEEQFIHRFPAQRTFVCTFSWVDDPSFHTGPEAAQADLAFVATPQGPLTHYTAWLGLVGSFSSFLFSPEGRWRLVSDVCRPEPYGCDPLGPNDTY